MDEMRDGVKRIAPPTRKTPDGRAARDEEQRRLAALPLDRRSQAHLRSAASGQTTDQI